MLTAQTPPSSSTKILLTGASGYLGQHLLSRWWTKASCGPSAKKKWIVVAAFHQNSGFSSAIHDIFTSSSSSSSQHFHVIPFPCDLTQPTSVDALFQEHPIFDACIHTAALSSPRICEQDPGMARRINVPEYFFQKLNCSRLIALSTDQVYDGTKDTATRGMYQEDADVPRPLNVYGQTKLEMETYLQEKVAESSSCTVIILRSSIILGPKAPLSQAHDTFLHFCASRNQQETPFFTNEYRTVVGIDHVCRVIDYFIDKDENSGSSALSSLSLSGIYNLGGPVRVNRYDMAKCVFDYLGYDTKYLLGTEQTSPTSPLDISMNSGRLESVTKFGHEPTTLQGLVESALTTDELNG